MVKRVYVFDEDVTIRAMLWKIFKPRGYLIHSHPRPGACPKTFYAQLDCASGRACGAFILASIDLTGVPRLGFIKEQINKKCCKVKNIGLMSTTWLDTDLEVARELGCEVFRKPFTADEINAWIDICEEKAIRLIADKMSEHAVLHH